MVFAMFGVICAPSFFVSKICRKTFIVHPTTGKKLGMKVQVASYQSQRVRDVQRRLANANIRDQKRTPKKT